MLHYCNLSLNWLIWMINMQYHWDKEKSLLKFSCARSEILKYYWESFCLSCLVICISLNCFEIMMKNQHLSMIILFSYSFFTKTFLSNSLLKRLIYLHFCCKMRFIDLNFINVHQYLIKTSLPDNQHLKVSQLDVFMITVQSSNAMTY